MFTFSLKTPTKLPIEVSTLTPEILQEKSRAEVERLSIWHGRQQIEVGDVFVVKQAALEDPLTFVGDLSSSVGIGAGMQSGAIRVEGNAGRNVGLAMWGGEIEITGSAGDGLGAEMQGGVIRVRGSAGDLVGAAQVGSMRGMTGGAILIDGDAGAGVGTRMRRGLIAIGGSAGGLIGHNMLAGTVVVGGACGQNPGAGMRRGTICLSSPFGSSRNEFSLLPTFRYSCLAHSPVLGLVGRELQSLGFENDIWNANRLWRQYNGDFVASGRGEVFLSV